MSRRSWLATVLALATAEALAEDSLWRREALFGDWAGSRAAMAEAALDVELVYTSEMLWNLHGGLDTGSEYRGDLSLTLTLNTTRAGWWEEGEFFAHVQAQHGDGLTERLVGDFQVVSNIDADDFLQLSEIWYRHVWDEGRWWVKLGKQETNEDFAFVEYGAEFINSSPGFSPTIPLVTYPDPDWGLAIGYAPAEWFSVNAGIFHGRPDGGRSIGATLDNLYGPMLMLEPAFHYAIGGQPGHLRFGLWWNGDRFEKLGGDEAEDEASLADRLALLASARERGLGVTFIEGLLQTAVGFFGDALLERVDGSASKDETYGFYLTWDQQIFAEPEDSQQGLGLFAQYGYADEDVLEAEHYYGFGVQWTGPLPGRNEDVAGIGIFHVNFSEQAAFDKGSETALELYYRAQLTPWFSVKPDVQFIDQPGGRNDQAWIAGLRVELVF